jgi:hypothetical protein
VARTLLALLLMAAAVACAQARDALQAIDDCVARLDTGLDVGYARIAERCPDLKTALTQSPWAPWLPADWSRPDNELSAAGLTELRTLLVRAARPDVARPSRPRVEHLAAVLAAVTRSDAARDSWWLRFKQWLRGILAPQAPGNDGGLRRWLERINLSSAASELIVGVALALVVALAAGIVLNELRIAGFLGQRERVRRRLAPDPWRGRPCATLEEIERAAPGRQPGLLLELIAQRLAEQDRLPPARALTARELGQRASLPDEVGRGRLAELVAVCERVRFSAEEVSAGSIAAALRSGRLLLAMLAAAPAARQVR